MGIDIKKDGWYQYINPHHYDGGMIICGECVLSDLEKIKNGLLNDSPVTIDIVSTADTPAQCDSCLKQSDDYDEVLDDGF